MGRTPDRTPGPALEEELQLEDRTVDGNPTVNGAVRYVSGDLVVKLPSGVSSLTTGTGLSEGAHNDLDQLVHNIAEDAFEEYAYSGNKVTDIIIWTDNGKTQKIRETNFTYTGNKVTQIVTKQYDGTGTLIVGQTMTESLTYSGTQVSSIDKVMS